MDADPPLLSFLQRFVPETSTEDPRDWLPRFQRLEVAAGHEFTTRERPVDDLFFLLSGTARFTEVRYGREVTGWLTDRAQVFTDLRAFREGTPARFTIAALTACLAYAIPRDDVAELDATSLAWNQATRRVWEQAFVGTSEAIGTFQAGHAEDRYVDLLEGTSLIHAAPLNVLASFIGVTPSSLSRVRRQRATRGR